MKIFIEELTEEVETTLQVIEKEEIDLLRRSSRSIEVLEKAFDDLKKFTIYYVFLNKEEEIHFFKETKPTLFCKLIYWRKLYNIEMNRPKGGEDEQRDYLKRQLCRLSDYFDANRDFYKYHRSNDTRMDEYYFLRQQKTFQLTMESFYFERDPRFSTAADFKMAKIKANDKVEKYLNEELERLMHRQDHGGASIRQKLIWTGKKIFLIELIYALYLAKVFNYGKATLREIKGYIEHIFNIDLGSNPSVYYGEMKIRKERTTFLKTLTEILTTKMDNDN